MSKSLTALLAAVCGIALQMIREWVAHDRTPAETFSDWAWAVDFIIFAVIGFVAFYVAFRIAYYVFIRDRQLDQLLEKEKAEAGTTSHTP
ncbi:MULTISPECIES: hypothetical protein [Corynebacterium]|uniref:Uncharacterized protein n=1 Tax=Corynebacterium timonense TaxID=441500 RepID=A0A1H1L933_9CORY|nr:MULTISPECIES: hypothetical protein [Corynebacterium]WJY68740.1 hypothetical protein CAURIS_09325 [Corynebacterium auris]SDR71104.1 hypothetical protein SAMN04488539_0118 [Corynebacterium timonense]